MHPMLQEAEATRRAFLTGSASGLGGTALAGMLQEEGLGAAPAEALSDPLRPRPPHFPARAKRCIFIFMAGAPSQCDLFDPKPKLKELDGQPLPPSLLANVRFAFIQKESATLMASKRTFAKYGQSGMEFSELLPMIGSYADDICMIRSMHTDQFNHHPGQLMMQCGRGELGLPSMGSWIIYGLGSVSRNLPGYVVLSNGRGVSGGATLWQSGFLPTLYAGVRFRSRGDAVLNLSNPPGISRSLRRHGLDALRDLNRMRSRVVGDPEIDSRIANYELAFRMQAAAPELCDLSGESEATLEGYGVNRTDPKITAKRDGGANQYSVFAANCLLARRLVERGVRFVNVIHGTWDHHQNLDVELPFNARMADRPIAALIGDLKQRGLLEDTLVVWGSEFGRTPLGENTPNQTTITGRDHHPYAFTIFMAGGGIRGGLVHGETDAVGWSPIRDPVHVNDFQATLLHLMGIDHTRLTYRFQGLDQRLTTVTRASHIQHALLA